MVISSFLKKQLNVKELSNMDYILCVEKLFNSSKPLISSIKRGLFYHDEPKLFTYQAELIAPDNDNESNEDNYAGGTSIIREEALIAALGEAIERFCLAKFDKSNMVEATLEQIGTKGLNIFEVINFTTEQLKKMEFKNFNFDQKSKFRWVKGYSLFDNKSIYIPAQLVYVPYRYLKDEKIIREPISTGAASGTSLGAAIYRGICEVVERDAFMITYLNSLKRDRIDLNRTRGKLKELYETYKRYKLDLHLVEITTDLKFPSFLGILLDYTRLGPAVSLGLGADLNSEKAAIKASEEAFHSRPWIRREMELGNKNRDVCSAEGRGLFWSDPQKIEKIKFLFSGQKILIKEGLTSAFSYSPSKLKLALQMLKQSGHKIYFVDLTTKEVRKHGFGVVKVIIPTLHPLFLDECYPYYGGKRLKVVPKMLGYSPRIKSGYNQIPHPFL